MFNFKMTLLNILFKFDIMSDLPGRLRLKVHNYKKIPKETINYQHYGIDAIKKLDGINSVKFNFVIGTILIEYDKDKLDSNMIINWLNAIKKLAIDNEKLIASLEKMPEEEAIDIMFTVLDNHIKVNSI